VGEELRETERECTYGEREADNGDRLIMEREREAKNGERG